MDTLLKHNKETERKFDKKFNGYWRGLSIPDEIKSFITSQNTELLKKIAKGEIARIEKEIKKYERKSSDYESTGTNLERYWCVKTFQDELTHWQQVLQDLEK